MLTWVLALWPVAVAASLFDPQSTKEMIRRPQVEVGNSDGYQRASDLLLKSLNESVDPCEDFYEFACGGWIANHPIPDDRVAISRFEELSEKLEHQLKDVFSCPSIQKSSALNAVKRLYAGCMDEISIERNGIKMLLDDLQAMAYWPIIHRSEWKRGDFDLTSLITNVGQRGVDVFVSVGPSPNMYNTSRQIISFDQPPLGLGSRSYYENVTKYQKEVNAYIKYMKSQARQIALDFGLSPDMRQIDEDVKEVFEFERKLALITVPPEDRRNFTALHNVKRFSSMQKYMPLIEWERYFELLISSQNRSYFEADPEVVVTNTKFFKRLTSLLKKTDPKVLTNYAIFRYLSSWGMQLGERYDDIDQDFERDMTGKKTKSPRWKDCTSAVTGSLGYAAGALYVRNYFNKEAKNTTMAMIDDLQKAFAEMLVENDWMDEGTKKVAQEKASAMLRLIAYPDLVLNDGKLDDWYSGLEFAANDTYASMLEKVTRWMIFFSYRRLMKPVDRGEFSSDIAVVNAFYAPDKNSITFPAGILQPPFFDADFPKSLNYGGIGAVIGHEITHGFDDQGSQFNAQGNLHNWWDVKTREKFQERTQCIIDQYSSFDVTNTNGLKLNGKLTQGENIADNGGVKEAYRAYQQYLAKNGPEKAVPGLEKYTNEQMFFIGYAQTWCNSQTPERTTRLVLSDTHSPGMFRVNVVLQNQPMFSDAFNCPANTTMNPTKRCAVW